MRDWNSFRACDSTSAQKFVGYLWGIETLKQDIDKIIQFLFVGYLWGIETRIQAHIMYERYGEFVGYLWGIETPTPE